MNARILELFENTINYFAIVLGLEALGSFFMRTVAVKKA